MVLFQRRLESQFEIYEACLEALENDTQTDHFRKNISGIGSTLITSFDVNDAMNVLDMVGYSSKELFVWSEKKRDLDVRLQQIEEQLKEISLITLDADI